MKTLILLLACSFHLGAQDRLPEFGEISDLKGMKTVYVIGDTTDTRKLVLDELKKNSTLEIKSAAGDAEFILECVQKGQVVTSSSLITEMPTFEMSAYVMKGEKRRIAWSKTKTSIRPAAKLLTGDFLNALKKAN